VPIAKHLRWAPISLLLLSLAGCHINSKKILFSPDQAATPIATGTWFANEVEKDGGEKPDGKFEIQLSSLTYLANDDDITDNNKEMGLHFFPIPGGSHFIVAYKLDRTAGSEFSYDLVKIEGENTVFLYDTQCPQDAKTGQIYEIEKTSRSECRADNPEGLTSYMQTIIAGAPLKPVMIYRHGNEQ